MKSDAAYTDLLMEMLSIPAISRKENERSDFLEDYLMGLDYDVNRIHNNLLVGAYESKDSRPRILLNSHLDTVSPVEGWESDPFTPLVEGDRITGLGSNDAGASVVTLISAYRKMQTHLKDHMNLLLLISAEEEVSGINGISAVLNMLGRLDAVIVGEPTGMHPAVAERGLMVLDAEVRGRAGHAARNEGENAIYKALKDIESIRELEFRDQSVWLPEPGAQVTMIKAGTGHNVVPDICRFVVDVRSNDRYRNEAVLEIIRSVCVSELTPRSTRLQPSNLDGDHFLMKTIRACGLKPFGSSTLSDMALIPFPAVKMGPGDSARSHSAGEYILKSEMKNGVELYCRFLQSMKEILDNHALNGE
jgi:acetylornithine deacetylase